MNKRHIGLVMTAAALALPIDRAEAAFTFSAGTAGTGLAATANFQESGSNLIITLSNVGGEVSNPSGVLTGLFFDISGATLTPVSANIGGSSFRFFTQPAGNAGNVGGEWAYNTGLAAPRGASGGIYSAGFDFSGAPNFNGPNLEGPAGVDGLNFGLLSQSDNIGAGNAQVTGNVPLVQFGTQFTLSGLPTGFEASLSNISNISFQYGTALTEPNIIPIPGAVWLLGSGLIGLVAVARRKGVAV